MQVPLFKILMDHKEPNHTVPSPIARPMPTQPPGSRAGEIPDVNTYYTLVYKRGVYCLYMYNVPITLKLYQPPPPTFQAILGHLTILCARGVGKLTFACVGLEKSNQKCQVSNYCFFRALKSLTAINTCLDKLEEFKGRDVAFVSNWFKKRSSKGLY